MQQKQLREDIATNNDFKLLTRSYQEHAIGQINFARFSVLSSREFSETLEEVFGDVKSSYNDRAMRKNIKNLVKKNGKDVWVLITANNKLYGNLIYDVCRYFAKRVKDTKPDKVDLIIIGRQGKNFFDAMKLDRSYKYFKIPDVNVTTDLLKEICANFISYENVYVFYGRFNNLISQTPTEVSLSGNYIEDDQNVEAKKAATERDIKSELQKKANEHFLFEPSIEEILVFFEQQILSLLLNQTVQEAQLGRFASRINAMEIAQNNIQKQLLRLQNNEKRFKAMQLNKKQLELLSGRALWNRR